ncbi:MAG: GNAT family N-acetyltransferase [Phycisphaerales bacterium]
MGVVVRRAREGDAARVAELAGQLGYAMEADVARERLARALASATRAVAIAESDGVVVAWIEVELRDNLAGGETAEITGLVVDRAARRSGAGRALVDWARGWAREPGDHRGRERGRDRLRVRSNARREEAAAFYPAVGFTLEKMQRVFVRGV